MNMRTQQTFTTFTFDQQTGQAKGAFVFPEKGFNKVK